MGVGAGLSALGGLASYGGMRDQSRAQAGALRRGLGNLRELDQRQQTEAGFTADRMQGLQGDFQDLTAEQIQQFAARPDLFQAMLGQAQGMMGDVDVPMRSPEMPGGTLGAQRMAQERAMGRVQPHMDVNTMRLTQSMMAPQMMQQGMDRRAAFAGMQRQGGEIGHDQALRQALLGRDYGMAMGDMQADMAGAGTRGMMNQALGGGFLNLAPGIAGAMMPPRQRQEY